MCDSNAERRTFPPEDERLGWKGGIKGSLFSLTTPRGVRVGVLSLAIHPNYEGLLEGTPGPRINPRFRENHLERTRALGGRVLEVPPRCVPLGLPGESGPDARERLPRYACSAHLALPARDPDALRADLTIAWWQETLDRPMAEVIGEAVDQVDWQAHAFEIPFF